MFKKQIVEIECYMDLFRLAEAKGFIETGISVAPIMEYCGNFLECEAMDYLESVGIIAIYKEET